MRLRRAVFVAAMLTAAFGMLSNSPLTSVAARDRTQLSSAQQLPETPTLKVYSRETFVDVTVTDAEGNPVHSLTRDDFTVLEDGVPMTPDSFAEHRSDRAPSTEPAKQNLPPNTFTNVDPTHSDGPINILLFDSSNTPVMTQHIVQTQMLDFVNHMRPGTRAAVLWLTYRMVVLQGVTTDRDLLRAAIASDKITPGAFALEDSGQDAAHADNLQGPAIPNPTSVSAEAHGEVTDPVEAGMDHIRGEYLLVAMKQLARFLQGMPGRKNLIWFTGFAPDFKGALTSEADLLARSHVTIYPIDPRGLESGGSRERATEDSLMAGMAAQTGGSFINTREMSAAVSRILDAASNYYTLTYVPTERAAISGQYRNITVKVNRPGVHLTYRPGYYATDPRRSLNNMKLPEPATAMQAAMERGGLEPTQILFRVKVDPGATDNARSEGNQTDPKRMRTPFRHLAVTYNIGIDGISFDRSGDGQYHASFEFGVMVYDGDGHLINTVSKQVRPVLSAAAYQSMLKNGAAAHQQVDVPARGEYFLRVGVHDLASNRVGALEVATSGITDTAAVASAPKP